MISDKKNNWLTILCCLLIAGTVITIAIMASVPPVSRDALTHHLAVPKLWIEDGFFKELPSIPFSYYPMNLDLLYSIPLIFGNEIVPKYIHFAFGLLTAYLIYSHLRSRLDQFYALLGALFFLSIPVIIKLSTTAYVDLGLIFFTTATLFMLIEWAESGFSSKHLVLAALSCGLALGTKYNGLIVLFLLTCAVPFLYLRGRSDRIFKTIPLNQLKALGWGVFFFTLSLLVFSPWMIRNINLTGNPIYPLYNNIFSNPSEHPSVDEDDDAINGGGKTGKKDPGWGNFAVRKVIYGELPWEIALIPIRVFFEGVDDDPKRFDGRLNPFLIILPVLLFLFGSDPTHHRKIEYRFLSLFSIAYLTFAFFRVDMRIRWISPIVPPLVVLCMYALAEIQGGGTHSGKRWKRSALNGLALVSVVAMFVWNAQYLYALYHKIDPIPYITGRIDRDTYITKYRPEYELIRQINQLLPSDATILCFFIGNRIYYFDRKIQLDKSILKTVVSHSDSVDQIGQRLIGKRITHMLVRFDLTDSWIEKNFDEQEKARLRLFLQRYTKRIGEKSGYGLFEVVPAK
ncbi:phospholipid carrier-dependent glycosyltransferase [uncultured Desulfosarcina sp.]|uniref:ArnT family glycosyltransferase n=1 Tax=uncultured Desulfosarcina sp. TaxID=218289 RepID=UPI0029C90D9F|nr:phospholipid carrier-dependent glycosyltransferase [uncultured Desulfosarcina sp.]